MLPWGTVWALLPSSFTNVLFQYDSTHLHDQVILAGTLQKNRADELTQIAPKDACSPESWLLFIPVALLLLTHWECCFPFNLLNTLYWQLFIKPLLKDFSLWGWFFAAKKDSSCWSLIHIAGHPQKFFHFTQYGKHLFCQSHAYLQHGSWQDSICFSRVKW